MSRSTPHLTRGLLSLGTALFGAILAAPTPAAAQELAIPVARQGYYLGGGMRGGVLSLDSSKLGGLGALQGFGGGLRFGELVMPWLGFGLRIDGGSGASSDWQGGYGGLLLEAQLQPFSERNLALHFGIGIAGLGVSRVDEAKKTEKDPSGGAGTIYSLSASWDWFPFFDRADGDRSGGFSIQPFVEAQLVPTDQLTTFAFLIGVEALWWSGLPDNKLDLPTEEAFKKR